MIYLKKSRVKGQPFIIHAQRIFVYGIEEIVSFVVLDKRTKRILVYVVEEIVSFVVSDKKTKRTLVYGHELIVELT